MSKHPPLSVNYGSFEHETFVTSIETTAAKLCAVYTEHFSPKGRDESASPVMQLDQAMRATAVLHEFRHLADCFGTIAGVSLFREYIRLLERFVHASRQASKELGRDWIFTAASRTDLPAYLRTTLNRLVGYHVASKIFRAPFRPIVARDPDDIQQVPIELTPPPLAFGKLPDSTVAAVRLQYATLPATAEEKPRLSALLHPIGFESLVEGNAIVVQRGVIQHRYGIDVDRIMTMYPVLPSKRTRFEDDELAAAALPYSATDLTITKILRKNGRGSFPRDAVLQATDLCLSQARFESVEDVGYLASSPGDAFIAIVEANSQELAEGRLKHPESVTKQYADLRTWIDEIPHHDRYANPFDLHAALGIIQSYALRQLTLPLVRERLETDHAAFTSAERSFGLLMKLAEANQGFPGVLVSQQGITFSPSMSPQVRAAWSLCAV
jgi:hypothetical protein